MKALSTIVTGVAAAVIASTAAHAASSAPVAPVLEPTTQAFIDALAKGGGAPIYTLTLPERQTCPASCPVRNACMGNRMNWAKKIAAATTATSVASSMRTWVVSHRTRRGTSTACSW